MTYWVVQAQDANGRWMAAYDVTGNTPLFEQEDDATQFMETLASQTDCLRLVKLTGEVQ